MGNTEQAMIMAEIRILKKHDEEQDKRIANLELKENINGATILKAISELTKENRENYKSLNEKFESLCKDNKSLHEDNKSLHEDNKSLHEDNKRIHVELQKINNKLDLVFELLSKRN